MTRQRNSPRICYIASPALFSKGAYAIHAIEMCKAMQRLNFDFEAVLPGSFKQDDIFEYYGVKKPFKLKSLPFTKGFGRQIAHGIAASLYATVNGRRFDIVLTRNIVCAALITRFSKLPTVYDAHHPPVNKAAELLLKSFRNSPNLKTVSFNSGGLRDKYLNLGLDESKTVVAHNGVDLSEFEGAPAKEEIRRQLGLPVGRKIVCYCGNTYAGRGVEILAEAAAEIKDALFLVVGGRDRDNAPYIESAGEKGIGNFLVKGFVPHSEVPLFLLASDVLTLPYTRLATIKGGTQAAGFTSPMKLFEYMASAKPIVATSIPTVLEVLEDGEDSVLVPPGDKNALVGGILKCLTDKNFSEQIAKKAREKVRCYTWEGRAEKITSRALGSMA